MLGGKGKRTVIKEEPVRQAYAELSREGRSAKVLLRGLCLVARNWLGKVEARGRGARGGPDPGRSSLVGKDISATCVCVCVWSPESHTSQGLEPWALAITGSIASLCL